MKTSLKLLLAIILASGFSLSGSAQKGVEDGSRFGHGKDSIRCLKNLSLYAEFYKQNNYEDAQEPWEIVYNECPKASKNIYLHGEKMIKDAIENTEDKAKKKQLVDSLMQLYDKRIKYYDQKGFVLGKKGTNFVKYAEKNVENFKKGHEFLKKSIDIKGNNSSVAVLVMYMQTSRTLFSSGAMKGKEVVDNYAQLLDILETNLEEDPNSSIHQRGLDAINKIFENSNAATCENLVNLFKPRFEDAPEDKALLQRITSLLDDQNCTESKLYADAAVNLNKLNPSTESAHHLAKLFYSKEQFEKAVEFYNQAIKLEEDGKKKSKLYMELAEMTFSKLNDKVKARSLARKAAEVDPENGKPYILIGRMYAESIDQCGKDEFGKKTVLWVAVDQFVKAKEVDPGVAEEADGYIKSYRPRFPDKKTIFFHNLELGSTYKIGCWINETTTVRTP